MCKASGFLLFSDERGQGVPCQARASDRISACKLATAKIFQHASRLECSVSGWSIRLTFLCVIPCMLGRCFHCSASTGNSLKAWWACFTSLRPQIFVSATPFHGNVYCSPPQGSRQRSLGKYGNGRQPSCKRAVRIPMSMFHQ